MSKESLGTLKIKRKRKKQSYALNARSLKYIYLSYLDIHNFAINIKMSLFIIDQYIYSFAINLKIEKCYLSSNKTLRK